MYKIVHCIYNASLTKLCVKLVVCTGGILWLGYVVQSIDVVIS